MNIMILSVDSVSEPANFVLIAFLLVFSIRPLGPA